jgi:hypothetical protein
MVYRFQTFKYIGKKMRYDLAAPIPSGTLRILLQCSFKIFELSLLTFVMKGTSVWSFLCAPFSPSMSKEMEIRDAHDPLLCSSGLHLGVNLLMWPA